jgi:hypothetical protein
MARAEQPVLGFVIDHAAWQPFPPPNSEPSVTKNSQQSATRRNQGKRPTLRFLRNLLIYLVAAVGLEPTTYGL